MKKEDFRIEETVYGFYIERKFMLERKKKINWFKSKIEKYESWSRISSDGGYPYGSSTRFYINTSMKPFKDIDKAKKYIDKLINLPKYHYLK